MPNIATSNPQAQIQCISVSSQSSNPSEQQNSQPVGQQFVLKKANNAQDTGQQKAKTSKKEKQIIQNKENPQNFHFTIPNIQIQRKPKVRLSSELSQQDKQFLIKRMLPQHLKGTNTNSTILILPQQENRARLLKVNPKRLEYEKINKNLSGYEEISKEMAKYVPEHYHTLFDGLTDNEKEQIYKDLVKQMNFIDFREAKYNEMQKQKSMTDNIVSLIFDGDDKSDEALIEFESDEVGHENGDKKKVQVVFFSQYTEYKFSESESSENSWQERNRIDNLRFCQNVQQRLGQPRKQAHVDPENRSKSIKQRTKSVFVAESPFQLKE